MSKYYHENCEGEVTGMNSDTQSPTCAKCGQSGEVWVKSRLDGTLFVFFRTQEEIAHIHEICKDLDDWRKRGLI